MSPWDPRSPRGAGRSWNPPGDARPGGMLWQPGQPVFWIAAACLAGCLPLQLIALVGQAGSPAAAAIGALMGTAQAVLLWWIARTLPRERTQPAPLRAGAFAWGFAVVPVLAVFAGARYAAALRELGLQSLSAAIGAPLVEDALRLAGVLGALTLASRRRITAMDGAVYGLLVGAGFEVAENLSYVLGEDDLLGTMRIALLRIGVGFGLHALWTAIAGAALAACLSRKQAGRGGRWAILVPGILAPMMLHALWDAPALSIAPGAQLAALALVYAASLALFALAAIAGRRAEAAEPREPSERFGRSPDGSP